MPQIIKALYKQEHHATKHIRNNSRITPLNLQSPKAVNSWLAWLEKTPNLSRALVTSLRPAEDVQKQIVAARSSGIVLKSPRSIRI